MAAPMTILFVCTGNICRSPTGQLLLQAELARRSQDAGTCFDVGSAGLEALTARPIDPEARRLLEKLGVPGTEGFRSRPVTSDLVRPADLVLTGTAGHRLRISADWPEIYGRTFTLAEAAALARRWGALALPQHDLVERSRAFVDFLLDERAAGATLPSSQLDIDDPHGQSRWRYRRMVRETRKHVRALAGALAPRSLSSARGVP